jgi:hypothetical protein
MKHDRARVVVSALSLGLIVGLADSTASLSAHLADGPAIHIEDVAAFYKLYDATNGHPTADQLQHDTSIRVRRGSTTSRRRATSPERGSPITSLSTRRSIRMPGDAWPRCRAYVSA